MDCGGCGCTLLRIKFDRYIFAHASEVLFSFNMQ